MVPDQNKTSLGLEYFCSENDQLWNLPDAELIRAARLELHKLGFEVTVEDGLVFRRGDVLPRRLLVREGFNGFGNGGLFGHGYVKGDLLNSFDRNRDQVFDFGVKGDVLISLDADDQTVTDR